MLQTTHYNLTKPELQDSPPDITVMNPNWDLIDTYLHEAYVNKLTAVDEIPAAPLPRDADRLGGFAADYFADKANAQMFKLTNELGLPLSVAPNFNTMTETGIYQVDAQTLNPIPGNATGILLVFKRDASAFVFQQYQANGLFYRYSSDNGLNWSSWKQMATAENAIVETGSNANGKYIKFGDGTMLAWQSIELKHSAYLVNAGDGISGYWPFPATFSEIPIVSGMINSVNNGSLWKLSLINLPSASGAEVVGTTASYAFTLGSVVTIRIMAIGRWK